MELAFAIQASILGILIISMILLNYKKSERYDFVGNLFLIVVLSSLLTQLLDALFYFVNGKENWYFYLANYFSIIIGYMLTFIPPAIWLLIVLYEAKKDKKYIYNIIRKFSPLYITIFILIITSPFTNLMFEIDSSNIYHRTIMFNFSTLLSAILVINTAIAIHLNRKFLSRKQYLTFSFFILPAIIGAGLQFYNPDFLFLWIGISISCLIFFMYLYSSYDDVDFITGLSNENEFIIKVNELLNNKTIFTLVLYELENISYKDTEILKEFANSIMSINPVGALISRNSYNTFSVITNSIDINFLKKALNSLDIMLEEKSFNTTYKVSHVVSTNTHTTYKSIIDSLKY